MLTCGLRGSVYSLCGESVHVQRFWQEVVFKKQQTGFTKVRPLGVCTQRQVFSSHSLWRELGAETPQLSGVLALAEDPDSTPSSHTGVGRLVSVGGLYS